ncbi:WD40-repeat-containing domain protein [Mycena crocata]|nr:WD40-repeat-containing domain protein [Mycena crocata]
MEASVDYTWVPAEYNMAHSPTNTGEIWGTSACGPSVPGNFPRSAKWCPDGSMALIHCEHRAFQVLDPFLEIQNESTGSQASERLTRTLPQPAPILDYAWYPSASSANAASFCFVASVRETPVKLLDASDGRLRASYRIVDHRERQIAPHSLAFNLSATKLYCGFEDAIEVFDIGRPGEGTRLHTSPSKKSRDGLKGIISALAFSPSYESDFYAVGSLAATPGNIAMFSEAEGAVPVLFVSGGPSAGVTQLHFNPMRPNIMYAAFRRRREVYSWDLRADVTAPLKIYSSQHINDPPVGNTNQKRRFDVDIGGRFLSVGDQEGNVSIFDLSAEGETAGEVSTIDGVSVGAPCLTYTAHNDAIGSVTFHPTKPALLSVSGSRHFGACAEESETDSDSSNDDDQEVVKQVRRLAARPTPIPLDPSIKLWDFGIHAEKPI